MVQAGDIMIYFNLFKQQQVVLEIKPMYGVGKKWRLADERLDAIHLKTIMILQRRGERPGKI